jgi:hypothetical protein
VDNILGHKRLAGPFAGQARLFQSTMLTIAIFPLAALVYGELGFPNKVL